MSKCDQCHFPLGKKDIWTDLKGRKFCSESCCVVQQKWDEYETEDSDEATRNKVEYRFDIIPAKPLKLIAEGFHYGAEKYGDLNWHKSRLDGNKGPINHALNHLNDYRQNGRIEELTHAAMNILMEMDYELRRM